VSRALSPILDALEYHYCCLDLYSFFLLFICRVFLIPQLICSNIENEKFSTSQFSVYISNLHLEILDQDESVEKFCCTLIMRRETQKTKQIPFELIRLGKTMWKVCFAIPHLYCCVCVVDR
jgi:hypothetical protein